MFSLGKFCCENDEASRDFDIALSKALPPDKDCKIYVLLDLSCRGESSGAEMLNKTPKIQMESIASIYAAARTPSRIGRALKRASRSNSAVVNLEFS
ncbi:hypothetical protein [Hyphomicrobium facile]|uniref:hypothetical protein n=1 Tax=Hyphomicrobium facile TaxID=51670 RepID=UPI000B8A4DD5|nr:hypothetical protein [Hyphomicrobium facile]